MSATWTPLDRNTHALRLAGARLTWYPIALPSRRQAAHPEPLPVEPLRDGSHQPPRTAKPGHPVKRDPASQQRRESSHMSNTETSGKGDPRAALLRRLNSARRNGESLGQVVYVSIFLRAWNAWRKGQQLTSIPAESRTGGASIPVPR